MNPEWDEIMDVVDSAVGFSYDDVPDDTQSITSYEVGSTETPVLYMLMILVIKKLQLMSVIHVAMPLCLM